MFEKIYQCIWLLIIGSVHTFNMYLLTTIICQVFLGLSRKYSANKTGIVYVSVIMWVDHYDEVSSDEKDPSLETKNAVLPLTKALFSISKLHKQHTFLIVHRVIMKQKTIIKPNACSNCLGSFLCVPLSPKLLNNCYRASPFQLRSK